MKIPLKNTKKWLDWSFQARHDINDIWEYIFLNDNAVINADLVYGRVENSAELLSSFPLLGKLAKRGLRLLFIPRTQLTIVYRVTPSSVRILRIVHQKKQSPLA